MIHYFTYNGRSSLDFGVRISGTGTFGAPEVDYEEIEVPGRNGSLLVSNHRFKPIRVSYPASIVKNLDSNLSALRAFLLSDFGEHRLTDSYHPSEYRMAAYVGGLEPDVTSGNKAARFTLVFACRPERWLLSGENSMTIPSTATTLTLTNPTLFSSRPLITVKGNGELKIGSDIITIQSNSGALTIDSEMEDVYEGSENRNSCVILSSGEFPRLHPGENGIVKPDDMEVTIQGRWYTL